MESSIPDGSLLVLNKWIYFLREPKIGEIVVFKNPHSPTEYLCKRIKSFNPRGQTYELIGDNLTDSLDSKKLGKIKRTQILGKVVGVSS